MTETHDPPGAYDDQTHSGRRIKTRGKRRKPYAIECNLKSRLHWLRGWFTWNRYESESARDQAYAVLVKKNERDTYGKREWRKKG